MSKFDYKKWIAEAEGQGDLEWARRLRLDEYLDRQARRADIIAWGASAGMAVAIYGLLFLAAAL